MRLAFLVPARDYDEQWRWAFDVEAEALIAAGVAVDPVPWTDAGDLAGYDLVLPLVAWGYFLHPRQWFALLDRFEASGAPVINPPSVLRWSSDKAYLAQLGAHGVPTVTSLVTESLSQATIDSARARFQSAELIVKPPLSAGADKTFRLGAADPVPALLMGQRAIVQPFVPTIAETGEYSLLLFDGVLSHCVIKRPAPGDFRVQPQFGGTTQACPPPAGSEAIAQAALALAPEPPTYARVDLIRDSDGALKVMELELVEPALFLELAPDRGAAFTAAILAAAQRLQTATA